MELKVIDVQLPEQISFNYEELKKEVIAKASFYEAMVYQGETEIKAAKADRATLNKLKKALNDERIRREKEYMQPFNDFKAKINEIITIIDKPVLMIDSQVKAYEEQQKAEKQIAIDAYFEGRNPFDWLKINQIFNEKWLNATVKMPGITVEIDSAVEQIEKDLETLSNLPDFAFEAVEEYKRTLDLNKAISEGKRLVEMQKRKAEAQQKMNEAVEQMKSAVVSAAEGIAKAVKETDVLRTTKVWISFKAHLTTEEALALRDFFDSRNIEFKAI